MQGQARQEFLPVHNPQVFAVDLADLVGLPLKVWLQAHIQRTRQEGLDRDLCRFVLTQRFWPHRSTCNCAAGAQNSNFLRKR